MRRDQGSKVGAYTVQVSLQNQEYLRCTVHTYFARNRTGGPGNNGLLLYFAFAIVYVTWLNAVNFITIIKYSLHSLIC
jgi:hypothetical protein